MTSHIVTGRLEDQRLTGKLLRYPSDPEAANELDAIPGSELVEILAEHIGALVGAAAGGAGKADAIGVAVPGIVRSGVIEESPNLKQLKGMRLAEELANALAGRGIGAPVHIANDADAIAAGVAATRGKLDKLTRVWTIGKGIGYGRWPYADGVWEGGHITVTLDPKERFCGCGGAGHLEGIMGHRAMGRCALPRVCRLVAPRFGCRDGVVHSSRRAGAILLYGQQCGIPRFGAAARPPGNDGSDEPAAKLLAGDFASGRRNGADRSGSERGKGAS